MPHATVGAALGARASSPFSAFLLGVASHFALDAIPHVDYSMDGRAGKLRLFGDAALSAGAVSLIARRNRNAFWGALGGITPDLISFSQRGLSLGSTSWHDFAHGRPARPVPSFAAQLALSAGAILLSGSAGGEDS